MSAALASAPGAALPKEVALVCLLAESPLVRRRWADLFGRGGLLGRVVDRIAAQANASSSGGSNVRLAFVLTDPAQATDPSRSPVAQTAFFLPPGQSFAMLSTAGAGGPSLSSSPLGRLCAGEEDANNFGLVGAGSWERSDVAGDGDGDGPEAQALLEGLVAALELFTHHQSRPFPASGASLTDLPMPTFTPIPNTTPLNLPPLPSSAATSPYPGRGSAAPPAKARGAVERHLLLISDGGLRLPPEGDEVRWNGESRFDGTTWATAGREVGGLDIRTSVILLGDSVGGPVDKTQAQSVDPKLLALVTPSGKPAGSAWFPTNEADRMIFPPSLAPSLPPPALKRALTSPAKREEAAAKRQRLSPAPLNASLGADGSGTLSLTVPAGQAPSAAPGSTTPGIPPPVKREPQQPPPVPAQVTVTAPRGAPAPANVTRPNGTAGSQPQMRLPPAIRPPPAPTTAVGASAANGIGLPPPSPVKTTAMQRSPLQASVARLGEQAGSQSQLPSKEQKQASTELLARLQARQGQLAGGAPTGGQQNLTPQQQQQQQLGKALPAQQPQTQQQPPQQQQQQQQRPGMPAPQPAYAPGQQAPQPQRPPMQQPSAKPFVWQGEVSWTVHSAGPKGGGNVLGCQVVGYAAHSVALEEFQAKTWPNRLHLSAVSPLQLNEIKRYVTLGRMPCITLTTYHKPGTSDADRQRGEQSYNSLARNLDSKKTMGHIRFGQPGCGMVIFAMGAGGGQPVKLMAMCFLKQPIPFATSSVAPPPAVPGQPQQVPQKPLNAPMPQQQQQQQQFNQTPANLLTLQQQQQQHLQQQQQQQGQGVKPQPTPSQLAALQQLRSNAQLQQQQARQQQQQLAQQQQQQQLQQQQLQQQQQQGYPQHNYGQQPVQQQQQQQQGGGLGVNMTQEQIAAILAAHQQSQQSGQGW